MALPDVVEKAFKAGGTVSVATASAEGAPNVIYVGYSKLLDDGRLVIADNYFNKTRKNIEDNPKIAVVVGSADVGSVQVKGTCKRLTSGPEYDDMLTWVADKHPRAAAVVIDIEEAYNGAKKLA
ncbi:MAG: pyridoxamine 5'-phosphate oxidase family protein [Planctomycetes bacterium]|nr:pyridoxamine 5'-phosphate oxidase family protein [Planctomycetota bacterium]